MGKEKIYYDIDIIRHESWRKGQVLRGSGDIDDWFEGVIDSPDDASSKRFVCGVLIGDTALHLLEMSPHGWNLPWLFRGVNCNYSYRGDAPANAVKQYDGNVSVLGYFGELPLYDNGRTIVDLRRTKDEPEILRQSNIIKLRTNCVGLEDYNKMLYETTFSMRKLLTDYHKQSFSYSEREAIVERRKLLDQLDEIHADIDKQHFYDIHGCGVTVSRDDEPDLRDKPGDLFR